MLSKSQMEKLRTVSDTARDVNAAVSDAQQGEDPVKVGGSIGGAIGGAIGGIPGALVGVLAGGLAGGAYKLWSWKKS